MLMNHQDGHKSDRSQSSIHKDGTFLLSIDGPESTQADETTRSASCKRQRQRTMGECPITVIGWGTIDRIDEIKNPEDREHACWKRVPPSASSLDPLWKIDLQFGGVAPRRYLYQGLGVLASLYFKSQLLLGQVQVVLGVSLLKVWTLTGFHLKLSSLLLYLSCFEVHPVLGPPISRFRIRLLRNLCAI
jgi:hypothetical protein